MENYEDVSGIPELDERILSASHYRLKACGKGWASGAKYGHLASLGRWTTYTRAELHRFAGRLPFKVRLEDLLSDHDIYCEAFVDGDWVPASWWRVMEIVRIIRSGALRVTGDLAGEGAQYVFKRTGDYWTIIYKGRSFTLRHIKGLSLIHELLQHPCHDVSAVELAQLLEPTLPDLAPATAPAVAGLRTADLGDAGPAIDDQTRRQALARIEDLARQISDAEQGNRQDDVAKLQEERDVIRRYLGGAVGLGGRARIAASPVERARSNLTNRLKDAIRRIEQFDVALAVFLNNAIKSGAYFTYRPDREVPWDL